MEEEVESITLHLKDGTTIHQSAEHTKLGMKYKRANVNPDNVGHKGEGRYIRHEVWWCDPPIDTPYGSD